MFENIVKFFKNIGKKEGKKQSQENSKDAAKERLHLVLMQDRANVSADFLELMKQEIIDVIKKYIEIDEKEIDVRLTNQENDDGTNGAPALYANIPILNIKNETRKISKKEENDDKANHQEKEKSEEKSEVKNEEKEEINQDKTKKENKKEINDNNKEEKQEAEKNNKKENKETANTENKKNNKKEDSKEVTEKEIKSE